MVLHPRPAKRCGNLDGPWRLYEQAGCGALGRRELCEACPRRHGCRWPGQYGARLRGARLILATQQQLALNPLFVTHLAQQTRARKPLVLVDESNLLLRPAERVIRDQDLDSFINAQQAVLETTARPRAAARRFLDITQLFQQASTPDLREGQWNFRCPDADWAADVQARGRQLYGDAFRFLGHELQHFGRSDRPSRERLPGGDVRFAALPFLGTSFIIFSGSMARELARYRLDPDHARPSLKSPFEACRFEHPGTRWFNLASLEGAAKFFPGNHRRILDFFAAKIARNIGEGKRTLLVSRKKFIPLCRAYLRERLAALGVSGVRIVTRRWDRYDLQDARTLSLINYGLAGVNRFEHAEAVYCLNSYFVTAGAVAQAVQDIEASTERFPVEIVMSGQPPRRSARLRLPDALEPITPLITREVFLQKEGDLIVQATGRVRPFTQPREVFTFHAGELPGVRYTLEFDSLAQARGYFRVGTAAQATRASQVERARRLRATGKTIKEIAAVLDVSVSTAKRYLRAGRGS
jgi:hypothetical protein